MSRKQVLRRELNKIIKKLERDYHPERVILFGSYASGKVRESSDIDLAVIKKTRKRFMDRLKEVILMCGNTIGVDFLVYTPGEFSKAVKENNPFICNEIIGRGKIIYEKK